MALVARMEESFDPVSQLTTLLGPKPNHPWGALIPQILLWCFRRFCIIKLGEPYEIPFADQVWDDHLDLIHLYAPKGLETAAGSWLTPENVEYVHSSLEEYNRFFMEFLVVIDDVMKGSDPDREHMISEFLDVTIKDLIRKWIDNEFLIFPMKDEDDDEFTDEQFNALLTVLMSAVPPESPPSPVTQALVPEPEFAFIIDRNKTQPAASPRGSTACMRPRGSYWGKTRRIRAVV
jgi:hypothetical protein